MKCKMTSAHNLGYDKPVTGTGVVPLTALVPVVVVEKGKLLSLGGRFGCFLHREHVVGSDLSQITCFVYQRG